MKYAMCKCGELAMWHSGYPIHPCQGCEECQTTLAEYPDDHRPLQPHQWQVVEETKTVDGVVVKHVKYEHCAVCERNRETP